MHFPWGDMLINNGSYVLQLITQPGMYMSSIIITKIYFIDYHVIKVHLYRQIQITYNMREQNFQKGQLLT